MLEVVAKAETFAGPLEGTATKIHIKNYSLIFLWLKFKLKNNRAMTISYQM